MSRNRLLLIVILIVGLSLLYVHFQVHGYDDRIITNASGLDTRDWPFGSVLSMMLTVGAIALAALAALLARRSRL